jgi:hypothetical protein
MDHKLIGAQLLARGTGVSENISQATDRHRVATASRALFEQRRQVARALLPAKIPLEAQRRKGTAVVPCCPEAGARYIHTRTVRPQT